MVDGRCRRICCREELHSASVRQGMGCKKEYSPLSNADRVVGSIRLVQGIYDRRRLLNTDNLAR